MAKIYMGVFIVMVICIIGLAWLDPPTPSGPTKPSYRLLFNEEFVSTSLNLNHWNTQMVWGRNTTGELQHYDANALALRQGNLVIMAQKQQSDGRAYSSGVITSSGRFEFKYGYAEIRARVPKGQGLWPAFWLAPSDNASTSEIDVMEILGHETNTVHMTLHFADTLGGHEDTGTVFLGTDFSADFHTFAVDWSPEAVVWYVDGIERSRQTTNVPDVPMYLIANLSIGGEWAGAPSADTVFPCEYEIDYIRVFKHE
ncbi:MAG: glycoside hydrolase family 16 protein [Coriobacteriia bacterium]|nr:glycoside hydrolase family 16 protein [Coriobacteriia bacterium]